MLILLLPSMNNSLPQKTIMSDLLIYLKHFQQKNEKERVSIRKSCSKEDHRLKLAYGELQGLGFPIHVFSILGKIEKFRTKMKGFRNRTK